MIDRNDTSLRKPTNRVGSRSALTAAVVLALVLCSCNRESSESAAEPVATQTTQQAPPRSLPPPVMPPKNTVSTAPLTVGALRIDPGGFDFGVIEPKSVHDVNATLHNTGPVPITILKVSPSCACTAPQDLAGTVVPAGGSIPFSATFSAPTEPGVKSAYIQLVFDAGGQRGHTKIYLQGVITMPVRATPPYVEALKGVTTGRVRVESVDGRPFRIISTNGETPIFADGFDPQRNEPRNTYDVQWTIPPRTIADCQGMRLWWVVETDHPDCPVLLVRVRHPCTGGRRDLEWRQRTWRFSEYIAQLGAIRAGVPVEVDVDIVNEKNVRIFAVQSRSSGADAELVSTSPKEGGVTTYRVRLTPRRGYEGMLYAMMLFRSDTGSQDIAFIGRVMPNDPD